MKIRVYNNGENVFVGPLEDFLRDNDNDEDLIGICSELESKDEIEFCMFSGDWRIERAQETTASNTQICDECSGESNVSEMRDCPINGIDSPAKVCTTCCCKCGYNDEDGCTFSRRDKQ